MYISIIITIIICFADFYVTEGNATGTVVGTVNGTDPDGDNVTFAITKTQASDPDFEIVAGSGDVVYQGTEPLDFETTPKLVIDV